MKIYEHHYGSPRSTYSSQPQVHRAAIESQMKCKSILAENTSQDFLGLSQPHGNSGTAGPQMSRNQRHHLKQQAARMQLTPVEKLPQGAARLMDGGGRAIGFPRLAMDRGDKAVLVKIRTISRRVFGRPLNARRGTLQTPRYRLPVINVTEAREGR